MIVNTMTARGWCLGLLLAAAGPAVAAVKIKDLGHFNGVRDNQILGYGLVVGLAGSGDSSRNLATVQSVSNMLREFGLQVPVTSVNSRNVAAVLVTANLPGFLRVGDRVDVNVSSVGDAGSLAGGTLLMTPLLGSDRQVYAVAQGAMSIGGYKYEQAGTSRQKNHPTSGNIPEGAIAEKSIAPSIVSKDGTLDLILNDPDFTTATRVASIINQRVPSAAATAVEAGRIRLRPPAGDDASIVTMVAAVEGLPVDPDSKARVIVNERTGTIVSGGNVWMSEVTVTQGDIKVSITQRYLVSQPDGVLVRPSAGIRSVVVPEATVDVNESEIHSVELKEGATIADLVNALHAVKASSRDVIAILQGIKRAGALHAELIIQ